MERAPESLANDPEAGERKPGLAHSAGRLLSQVLREVVGSALPAIVIALTINLFLAQATVVRGQSMEPSLHNNQRLIMEKVTYHLVRGPRRGDIAIIDLPGQDEPLVKRVVGLPGETVEVRYGRVLINGRPLDEPWTVRLGGPDYPSTLVPPLHVFVLGDNRGGSNDSRSFGPVLVDQIIGRAWLVYWPLEQAGLVQ